MNKTTILLMSILVFFSCNFNNDKFLEIAQVFENYYQESLKLYPLQATSQGDLRYNDFLPNDLSDEFRTREKEFYTFYKSQLNNFPDQILNENDLLSNSLNPEETYISIIIPRKIRLNRVWVDNYSLRTYFDCILRTLVHILRY